MKPYDLIVPTLLSSAHLTQVSASSDDLHHHYNRPKLENLVQRQALSTSTDIATLDASINTSIPMYTTTTLLTTTTSTYLAPSSSSTTTTITATNKNHNIMVGYNNTQFTPSTLKAISQGDTLTFYFYPTNYSVIQSSFSAPCRPLSDNTPSGTRGIFSGWNPTVDATSGIARSKFVLTLATSDTLWLYAYDGSRAITENDKGVCEEGMSMVVNPGVTVDGSGTLSTYRKRAGELRSLATTEVEKVKLVGELATVPSGGVWGGLISGVSDKELARWEGKHPWPLNGTVAAAVASASASGNGTSGDGGDGSVEGFTNGSGGRVKGWDRSRGWVGVLVVLGAGAFGLGL